MNRTENVKLVLTTQLYLTGDLGVIISTVYGTSSRLYHYRYFVLAPWSTVS